MRGTTHAMHGAAVGALVGQAAPPTVFIACIAAGSLIGGRGPDIDHKHSTTTKGLGNLSRRLWRRTEVWARKRRRSGKGAWVGQLAAGLVVAALWLLGLIPQYLLCPLTRWWSRQHGLPPHRGLTHNVFFGIAVGALAVGAPLALIWSWQTAVLIATAAAAGWAVAVVADWLTYTSTPHALWPLIKTTPALPDRMRITTGKWQERCLVTPTATAAAGCGVFDRVWLAAGLLILSAVLAPLGALIQPLLQRCLRRSNPVPHSVEDSS